VRIVDLAGTRIAVSRLGLGTASLHHLLTTGQRQRLLAHALASGITYFDTAPLYGHGIAERELGRFLKGRRSEVTVATKFGQLPGPLQSRFPVLLYGRMVARQIARRAGVRKRSSGGVKREFSVAAAIQSFDASLRRLAVDCVDILYLHEPELAGIPDPAGLVDALVRLRASGKVRYFGLSGFPHDCREISAAHPPLAEILQLDTASSNDTHGLPGLIPHVTFGHFRNGASVSTDASGANWIEQALSRAVQLNTSGVILFSTRRCAHIDAVASAMQRVDGKI
jgi:D-threo-aldose 1-dehydrogenase